MDLINELRKLEGINTSFDYGVEIIVMTVKETIGNWETLKTAITNKEIELKSLFEFDKVCKNGFKVAKKFIFDYIVWHTTYLEFIKQFRYDNTVYCSIDDDCIILFVDGMGQIWKQQQMDDMMDLLVKAGFMFRCDNRTDEVEFRIIGML